MTISYYISVPSFKLTAFVVSILASGEMEGGGGGKFIPPPCFNATSEPPWTIGLTLFQTKLNFFVNGKYLLK